MPKNKDPSMSTTFLPIISNSDAALMREQLLQKISTNPSLPALGSSVSHVVQLASSNDEAVRKLAHFILSDAALTQRILRLSNTVGYRTAFSTPVTTISKAIFLLGFEAVKTSALAMMLVEGMARSHAKSVKAELAHALCASVIGRELARQSHFKDAEEAAVAALFKNMGRLLVASFDHSLYSEIIGLMESGTHTPAQASMQVFGCSFEALAESVLQEWQIPDSIVQALVPVPQGALKPPKTKQEWMQQVAAFSAAAATMIPHFDPEAELDNAAKALLKQFGAALNLDKDKLNQLFAVAAQETRALVDNMDLDYTPSAPDKPAVKPVPKRLPAELLLTKPEMSEQRVDACHASGKPLNARDLLLSGVQDVTEMMASGRCKVNDLILLALETLYRSMGFRFAVMCVRDMKNNEYRARIGLGENNMSRQSRFVFPATVSEYAKPDLFHLAIENDADLFISDSVDTKIIELLPAWHKVLLPDARSFIVIPLVVQKKPFGLFYADRVQPAPEGVPQDETALIKTLKGQVLAALTPRG